MNPINRLAAWINRVSEGVGYRLMCWYIRWTHQSLINWQRFQAACRQYERIHEAETR